jgi:hypothetical protein
LTPESERETIRLDCLDQPSPVENDAMKAEEKMKAVGNSNIHHSEERNSDASRIYSYPVLQSNLSIL